MSQQPLHWKNTGNDQAVLGLRAQSILHSPNLQPRESEIVDAVFQSEKFIRGEPMESCKLRYFNSFEFFDHTGLLVNLPELAAGAEITSYHRTSRSLGHYT
jgi:hypothetical protein